MYVFVRSVRLVKIAYETGALGVHGNIYGMQVRHVHALIDTCAL